MAEVSEESVMTKEHRTILRKHRRVLEENLQPLKLLSYLTDVLSSTDEEDIRAERTTTEQTTRLLDLLPRRSDKAFEAFVRALEKKQGFLAIPIAKEAGIELLNAKDGYNEHCMQPEHKDILRSNRGLLRGIKLNTVLDLMAVIFDKDDIEEINSKSTDTARLDEFITILMKKEDKCFDHFVTVLKITDPSIAKSLIKEKESLDVKNDLKNPTQIVHPEDETEISQVKLPSFCKETDRNENWKSLAQNFQILLEEVQGSWNPTFTVIQQWSSMGYATVGGLKQVLTHLGMTSSLKCLEQDLLKPKDMPDAPLSPVNALVKKTEKLSIDEAVLKPMVVKTVGDLSEELQERLARVIEEEMVSKNSFINPPCKERQKFLIRDLTRLLRGKGLENSIKWMKTHLPSGVTGPLYDEYMNVRDMPYSVRSRLTIQLCGNDNWKLLACRLRLSNVEINYFDSSRFKNPADEVLKQWEIKRNSTVGELYDILVELNMPVIADSAL